MVPRLGVVLFKRGRELMPLFASGRVLVEREPENMARLPSGRIPDAQQPLLDDASLHTFFTDERVITAAGGMSGLEYWLRQRVKSASTLFLTTIMPSSQHYGIRTARWWCAGIAITNCVGRLRRGCRRLP